MLKQTYNRNDAVNFYTLLRYYNPSSPNVAVLGDEEKFKKLVKIYKEKLNSKVNCKFIKVNNKKVTFIIDDIEITIILINNEYDLDKHNLKFSKYL